MSGRLASLVDRQGAAFASDPARVRDLLRSWLGDLEPEVTLLVAGAEEGITIDLVRVGEGSEQATFNDLAQRLVADRGLSPSGARWVVDTWAWALGIDELPAAAPSTRLVPSGPGGSMVPPDTIVIPEAADELIPVEPPRFRLRDQTFPAALIAFVLATLITMVALSRGGAEEPVAAGPARPASPVAPELTVSVPSLLTLSRAQAVERLEALGLDHEIVTRRTQQAVRGAVLRQEPAPGVTVPEGSLVSLVVAAPPLPVGSPVGLSFDRTPTSVTMTWDAPGDGAGVHHYEIWRDGRKIGERGPGNRTFTDAGLEPGTTHLYGVKAIGHNGTIALSRSRRIVLPSPPPADPDPDPGSVITRPPQPPPPPPTPPCEAPDPAFCG